jgi:hypothetical protein
MKTRIQTGRVGSRPVRGICRTNVRLAALAGALALGTAAALAQTNEPANHSAPIPLDQLGAVAGRQYQGDALGITATADGAILRCGFQKLEGRATTGGLWLESTEPGAKGQLRILATAVSREVSDCGSPLPLWDQPCITDWTELFPQQDLPRSSPESVGGEARHSVRAEGRQDKTAAQGTDAPYLQPLSTLNSQPSTLPATGTVEVTGNGVRFTRPGLTEEYSVNVDGVRQDFVIADRPAGAGELRVELALSGARAEAMAAGAKLTMEQSGRGLVYSRLRATDAIGKQLPARLEVLGSAAAPAAPVNASLTGRTRGTDLRLENAVAREEVFGEGADHDTRGACAPQLIVVVNDADAVYPVRIDPTFSDADWVSLNPGIAGANDMVRAIVSDADGNVYVGGNFTFIGTVAANRIAKWNGSAWSALGSGVGEWVYALAVSGTDLFAGGRFTSAGGMPANRIAKWNGSTWSALGSGLAGASGSPEVYSLAVSGNNLYAGGRFTTAGGIAANSIAKWDGSTWSPLGSGTGGYDVEAMAVSGTNLYVGGFFPTVSGVAANGIAKWDGSTWSALGSGVSGDPRYTSVFSVAVSGTNLYVGGDFTNAGGVAVNGTAKWNGSTWSAVGSGIMHRYSGRGIFGVNALAVNGTNLYAGGSFYAAGGALADNIAKWNGSDWSAVAPLGVNGRVRAFALNGTDLYVGGDFISVRGVAANHIAKWNGSAWSALGSGIVGYGDANSAPWVLALAVSGTNLYVGGYFTNAGGTSANRIAKWDGNAWSALGSGLDTSIYSRFVAVLAVSGSDLYVGGAFTAAGGVPANYIAKWNGSTWSALGSGMDSWVYGLAVSGNDLYAGGSFTTAGGVSANYIAKWNGSSWSALGSGMNDPVGCLALSGTNLYAGGVFEMAGGVSARKIAKWNGSTWSALGSGMNRGVGPLAVSGTNLYAAGDFSTAGGVPANYIAKWDGNVWSALGSGTDNDVYALAADAAGHLFVGGDFVIAGDKASPFLAQLNLVPQPIRIDRIRVVGGMVVLDCCGRSGNSCSVQRASDARFTQNVTTLLQTNAPPNGAFCHTDPNPPNGTVFYRLTMP